MEFVVEEPTIHERIERLRDGLTRTENGRKILQSMTPAEVVRINENVVDFCDWSQFSQWPQSS